MQVLATPTAACEVARRRRGGGRPSDMINNALKPAQKMGAQSPAGKPQQALTATVRASLLAAASAARRLANYHGAAFSPACVTADRGAELDPGDRFAPTCLAAMFRHRFRRKVEGKFLGS